MGAIETFFEALNEAWDKEPETLIELGITDEVFMKVQNYVTNPDKNYWSTTELQDTFKVLGFGHGYCAVERKSDGVRGSVDFDGRPRQYFNFKSYKSTL